MKITFSLQQRFEHPDSPNNVWQGAHKYQTEIAGEPVHYAIVSQKYLDRWAQGSPIGYSEGNAILLSRQLHPTHMPLAALYLTFEDMAHEDLVKRFGDETMENLHHRDISRLVMSITLDIAGELLRPEEYESFVEKMDRDARLKHRDYQDLFADARDNYLVATQSEGEGALVRREGASLEHYVGAHTQHREAVHRHRRSRASRALLSGTALHARARRFMATDITKADLVLEAMMRDDFLDDATLPGIVEFLSQLRGVKKGDTMSVSEAELDLLSYCTNENTHDRGMVEIVERNTDGSGVVRMLGFAGKSFGGLVNRLGRYVDQQIQSHDDALRELRVMTDRLLSSDELQARLYATAGTLGLLPEDTSEALVPYTAQTGKIVSEHVGEALSGARREAALSATFAPQETKTLVRAEGALDDKRTREEVTRTGKQIGAGVRRRRIKRLE